MLRGTSPDLVLNFFSFGDKMASKKKTQSPKKVSQKHKQKELEIIKQACEMERNFQKACEMADGFPPPKSEEDFRFLEKWLFLDFLSLQIK